MARLRSLIALGFAALAFNVLTSSAHAITDLGVVLLGNDLTDKGNNGNEALYAPPNLAGFDAVFFANDEPGFGGGESSFNVFDNLTGGGNNKWCCNSADVTGGIFVGADFRTTQGNISLTHFTIASDNDSGITRDPDNWAIEGSTDGVNWFTIFGFNTSGDSVFDNFGGSPEGRVLRFDAGVDFASPAAYSMFRYHAFSTVGNGLHSISEVELFGNAIPEPMTASLGLMSLAALALRRRGRQA